MKKRAQVTVFVILGILVVVLGIILFLIINPNSSKNSSQFPVEIQNYIEDCFKKSSKETIVLVSQGGGYLDVQNFSNSLGVTYYYFNRTNYFPSLERIEKEISQGVEKSVLNCAKEGNFSKENLDFGEPNVSTQIKENSVKLEMDFPISYSDDDEEVLIDSFSEEVEVRLGLIYEVVEELLSNEIEEKGICLSCIYRLSLENNLKIDLLDAESLTTIFSVKDYELPLEGDYFEFVFANDYSEENGI